MYKRIKLVQIHRLGKDLIVKIAYKDNKSVTFSVDRGDLSDKGLLKEAFRCVFLQVEA